MSHRNFSNHGGRLRPRWDSRLPPAMFPTRPRGTGEDAAAESHPPHRHPEKFGGPMGGRISGYDSFRHLASRAGFPRETKIPARRFPRETWGRFQLPQNGVWFLEVAGFGNPGAAMPRVESNRPGRLSRGKSTGTAKRRVVLPQNGGGVPQDGVWPLPQNGG